MLSNEKGQRSLRQRLSALFQDHEIFIRTKGQVRFLRVSAKMQKRAVLAAFSLLILWSAVTLSMAMSQFVTANDRALLSEKQAEAAAAEKRIAAYRDTIGDMASDLHDRQLQLEEWQQSYFGTETPDPISKEAPASIDKASAEKASAPAASPLSSLVSGAKNSQLPPELRRLMALAARQEILSARLLAAVQQRATNAETAVAKLGLNPDAIVRSAASGRGGPFIPHPVTSTKARALGSSFAALDKALFRMEVLERTLVAVPSGNPADILMMSSGFGRRSDPFSGASAVHSGLDFRGPIGTPILSAAPGRVSFVGVKSGYGNVVEVDHGQGIMTRYAHLSGFTTKVGHRVAAGQQIAKMGSTGRSTGSHLHFEVRLNGVAVNPRRFLDAKAEVLTVKQDASERVGTVVGRAI